MSWHYLRGQEEASWEESSLDGAPSALLNLLPIRAEYCSQGSATAYCQDSPSGTMCEPLTGNRGADALTSSRAGSPAKHLAKPQEEETTPRIFGLRCSESCSRCAHGSCLGRTSRDHQLSGRPRSSSLTGGVVRLQRYPPPHWVRRILGRDGGYLATPTATANQWCPSMQKHPGCRGLARAFGPSQKTTAFEFLMGWPIGWTDLKPLETGRSRNVPRQLSLFLGAE